MTIAQRCAFTGFAPFVHRIRGASYFSPQDRFLRKAWQASEITHQTAFDSPF
jgi:hypothetical protein